MLDQFDNYDSNFQLELAKYFKEQRLKSNVSIEYVAKYLDILPSRYARYENGTRSMPLSIMKRLASFYNLDYYETFKLIDNKVFNFVTNDYIKLKQIDIKDIKYNSKDILERIEKLERIVKKLDKEK